MGQSSWGQLSGGQSSWGQLSGGRSSCGAIVWGAILLGAIILGAIVREAIVRKAIVRGGGGDYPGGIRLLPERERDVNFIFSIYYINNLQFHKQDRQSTRHNSESCFCMTSNLRTDTEFHREQFRLKATESLTKMISKTVSRL